MLLRLATRTTQRRLASTNGGQISDFFTRPLLQKLGKGWSKCQFFFVLDLPLIYIWRAVRGTIEKESTFTRSSWLRPGRNKVWFWRITTVAWSFESHASNKQYKFLKRIHIADVEALPRCPISSQSHHNVDTQYDCCRFLRCTDTVLQPTSVWIAWGLRGGVESPSYFLNPWNIV